MSAATICPPSIEPDLPPGAVGRLTIDLDALAGNWRQLTAAAGPGVTVGAVVKADGYGLGLAPVALSLAAAGCRWFFVALLEEGEALARAFAGRWPEARIGVFSGPLPGTLERFLAGPSLVPVLNDLDQVEAWRMRGGGRPAILHLDTGMARLGLPPEEALALAADPARRAGLALAAVMSHLACADEPAHPHNALQLARFERLSAGFPAAPRSLAASSGFFLGPGYRFDLVRAGAALYGLNPTPGAPNPMRQVVGVQARILQVRAIDRGSPVGYGAAFTTDRPRLVATIGLGYADGLPRNAGNRARCHVGPMEAPIIGRISMDLATLDVSAIAPERVRPGRLVELIGPHHDADALAAECGTIGHDILTGLGPRLHRVYRGGAPC